MAKRFEASKTRKSVKRVSKKVLSIYSNREILAFAIASSLATRALNEFRNNQANEKYWKNRTQQAFQRVFSSPFADAQSVGFFLAHGVDYGVYLELANNRQNASLNPIITKMAGIFLSRMKELYGIG